MMTKRAESEGEQFMSIRAVLRGLYGTDLRLSTLEERERAVRAIGQMEIEAKALQQVVASRVFAEPIEDVHKALEAIAKDLSQ